MNWHHDYVKAIIRHRYYWRAGNAVAFRISWTWGIIRENINRSNGKLGVKFGWTADRTRSASRGLSRLVQATLFKGFGIRISRVCASWPHQSCYKARLSRRDFSIGRSTPTWARVSGSSHFASWSVARTRVQLSTSISWSYRYQMRSQAKPRINTVTGSRITRLNVIYI